MRRYQAQLRLNTIMELFLWCINGCVLVGTTGLALWLWSIPAGWQFSLGFVTARAWWFAAAVAWLFASAIPATRTSPSYWYANSTWT